MRVRDFLIVSYLAVQLLLPLRAFVRDKYETRGHFSWNMYAYRYTCKTGYAFRERNGEIRDIDYTRYFNDPSKAPMVLHHNVLPRFHAWLCDQTMREGRTGPLQGYVRCTLNDRPAMQLVSPDVDLCSAPDFGVSPL